MKFEICGKHLRALHRAIVYSSRICSQLFFEALPNGLIIRGGNEHCYSEILFKENFFNRIEVEDADDTEEFNENHFKISVRPCLKIFKHSKNVVSCTITMDATTTKLIITQQCEKKVKKTRTVTILDHEIVQSKDLPGSKDLPNKFVGTATLLSKILTQFPAAIKEITIDLDIPQKLVKVRNFIEYPEKDTASTRTQYQLSLLEFQNVTISCGSTTLAFCLKFFKAIVHFAKQTKNLVKVRFQHAGPTLWYSVKDDKEHLYLVNLFMSSIDAEIIEKSRRKEKVLLLNNAKKRHDSRIQSGLIHAVDSEQQRSVDAARDERTVAETPLSMNEPNSSHYYSKNSSAVLNVSKKRKKNVDAKTTAHYKRLREIAYGNQPSKTMTSFPSNVSEELSASKSVSENDDIQQQLQEMSQLLEDEVEDPFPELSQHSVQANAEKPQNDMFKKPTTSGFTFKRTAKPIVPSNNQQSEKMFCTESDDFEDDCILNYTEERRGKENEVIFDFERPSTSKSSYSSKNSSGPLPRPAVAVQSEELFSNMIHDSHIEVEESISVVDEVQERLHRIFRPCFEATQDEEARLRLLAGEILAENSDPEN